MILEAVGLKWWETPCHG